MPIPLAYVGRNLVARKVTTLLTAGGLALVVYVFATVLMLDEGLRRTLVGTGSWDNAIVIRRAAETEVQSGVDRDQAGVVESQPEVAFGGQGSVDVEGDRGPHFAQQTCHRKAVECRHSWRGAEGLGSAAASAYREGRLVPAGTSESHRRSTRSVTGSWGGHWRALRFGTRDWTVVGHFDAGHTGFDSEIWGDADQLIQAFRRNAYSSVIFRLTRSRKRWNGSRRGSESDPRLTSNSSVNPCSMQSSPSSCRLSSATWA